MAVLRITKQGENVLKQKSKSIEYSSFKEELSKLLNDMWETMYAAQGVGLAAPQIGLSLRIAVIDIKPDGKSKSLVLINPQIIERFGVQEEEEGCLSIPGLYAKIRRSARVRVKALNRHGIPVEFVGEGLLARAFQHEIDHLNGKLFIDHLPFLKRLRVLRIIKQLKKNWK